MKKLFVNVQIVLLGLLAIISFTATAQTPKIAFSVYLPLILRPQETPTPTIAPTQTATPTLSPTPTFTSTQTLSPTPTFSSTPTQTATPTTPPPATTGDIRITTIFYDGSGTSEPDEFVEIRNYDTSFIQVQNWTLRDLANHIYTFPNFVMAPSQTCRIYTNEIHPDSCGFSYGSASAIWNNSGDTAYLRNSIGTLIYEYSY